MSVGDTMRFETRKINGKPGIFWERGKATDKERKITYKTRDQRFALRKEAQPDTPGPDNNIFAPKNLLKQDDEVKELEEKKKAKPAPNFIQRNRRTLGSRPSNKVNDRKGVKDSAKADDEKTLNLTQEQLTALLESVGKLTSGKKDALKISLDPQKHEINITSPRKHRSPATSDDEDEGIDSNSENSDGRDQSFDNTESVSEDDRNLFSEKTKKKSIFAAVDDDESLISVTPGRNKKGKGTKKKKVKTSKNNEEDGILGLLSRESTQESLVSEPEIKKSKSRKSKESSEEKVKTKGKKHVRYADEEEDDDDNKKKSSKTSKKQKNKKKEEEESHDDRDTETKEAVSKKLETRAKKESKDSDNETTRESKSRSKTSVKEKETGEDRKADQKKKRRRKKKNEDEEDLVDDEVKNKEIKEKPKLEEEKKEDVPLPIPKKHLTLAERKRLEWELEAKAEEERNPFVKDEVKITASKPDLSLHDIPSPPASKLPTTSLDRKKQQWQREKDEYEAVLKEIALIRVAAEAQKSEPLISSVEDTASPRESGMVPRAPLTAAERKKLQWERERGEQQENFSPWGKPGAGAPLRSDSGKVLADYKTRQDNELRHSIEQYQAQQVPSFERNSLLQDFEKLSPRTSNTAMVNKQSKYDQFDTNENFVPSAMRTSVQIGVLGADDSKFKNKQLDEKKKWLEDIEKQIEENRLKKLKHLDTNPPTETDTWADKFSNYKPQPLPDQKLFSSGFQGQEVESGRISSAPNKILDDDVGRTHIRGQNVHVDPSIQRDLEEKRKRHLEHQAAIKAQIEEKRRLKQLELDKKMMEDMEEEKKLQDERDQLQLQFELEQEKQKKKEEMQNNRVEQLKRAMDEAQERALMEKQMKRLQHLQQAGHDVSHLRASLEDLHIQAVNSSCVTRQGHYSPSSFAKLSPRLLQNTQMDSSAVQGSNLSSKPPIPQSVRQTQSQSTVSTQPVIHEPYTENRTLTPSQYRHPGQPFSDPSLPQREFGTQTEAALNQILASVKQKEYSDVEIMYNKKAKQTEKKVRVVSAPKEEKMSKVTKKRENVDVKRRPRWNNKAPEKKKALSQSQKDLNYEAKKRQSEKNRIKREQQLMAEIEKNKNIIPTERPAHSSLSDHAHCIEEYIQQISPRFETKAQRRAKSQSPQRGHEHSEHGRRNRSKSPEGRSKDRHGRSPEAERLSSPPSTYKLDQRSKSPVIPAVKRQLNLKINDTDSVTNNNNYKHEGVIPGTNRSTISKYGDSNPVTGDDWKSSFYPFTRTAEILDPANAERPLPESRESSAVGRARKAYIENQKPASYGNRLNMFQDKERQGDKKSKNPILHPEAIKDHPTARQDQILQQLNSLKQNLMQRQRELETCMSPSDFE